jgi:uncharacterized phage protein gp47/JayE
MAYGITAEGFNKKPLAVCLEEIETNLREEFGDEIDLTSESPFGQLAGIMAEREADLWDHMEDVYNSQYPDTATGASLVNVAAITGTVPDEPTKSTVTVTATGTPGTLITAGRIFQVVNNGARFVTLADATIPGGGSVAVDCEAEDTGPSVANAGTLTVIVTAVAGLSSITNALDAELGEDLETDAELRERREEELRTSGNAALEAVRQDVLAVDGVEDARAFENTSDTTDGDGLPAHSIEIVTLDDEEAETEQAILEAIFASKAGGIYTHGSVTGTVTDSEGTDHTVRFNRATEKWAWLTFDVVKNPASTLTDAEVEDAVTEAFLEWAEDDRYGLGADLVTSRLDFPVWQDCEGFVDDVTVTTGVTATGAGAPAYTSANKTVASREILRFDTSRITVNVS